MKRCSSKPIRKIYICAISDQASATSILPFFAAARRGVSEYKVLTFTSGYIEQSKYASVLLFATANISGVHFHRFSPQSLLHVLKASLSLEPDRKTLQA